MIEEDKKYSKIAFDEIAKVQTFENCRFSACDFNGANFTGKLFIDCVFQDCNLSLMNVNDTGLQNTRFKNCKLSGVNFTKTRDFLLEMHFEGCILDNAVFYKKKNKKSIFKDCSMIETDLTEADLTEAKFENCNLNRAFFERTVLRGADLSTSYNFVIDPDINDIKKAKFSVHGLQGL